MNLLLQHKMDKNGTILVVDDISENLQILGSILSHEGYDVNFATNGNQAIAIASELLPDLILLDISMPGLDGFEVCKQLKSQQYTRHIPIIFLTARTDYQNRIEGFSLGAADYVTKPFNFEELLARVKVHIELKIHKDLINKKNIELKDTIASKDQLFSIIAHDLKSPFSGVMKLTDVLLKNFENNSPEKTKSQLTAINESIKKTYYLLENLVEWRKIQTKNITPELSSFLFIKLYENSVENIKWMAEAKNQTLTVTCQQDLEIVADLKMLTTVLRNLISNAIKFTHEKGSINIKATGSADEVQITVGDNGIGMDADTLNSLWGNQKTESAPGTNNEKGTGLGLKFVKSFVEKHKGTVEVNSIVDKGTEFCIRLPR